MATPFAVFSPFINSDLTPAYLLIAIWTMVVLGVLALILRQPRTLTLAKDEQGSLRISRHALHRMIEACCTQLKGIASARATVRRRGGKFITTIHLKIRPNAKVDAIQGYLTQEVASIYRDNLGITDVGPVEIKVTGVIAESSGFE